MKGWFDAFREDGGPTLYSYSNRTSADEDVNSIFVYLIFATLFVAFLIIFPGIRKERFTTFVSVSLSLFVGLVILLTIYGSDWHVAWSKIIAPYKAFSRDKIEANLGVHIGLNSVNVTLKAPIQNNQTTSHIQYNERFYWMEATEIKEGYREALVKGLPFPILTIVEYLSLQGDGFSWGGRYRIAGYFSCILLWASFAIWLLMNILFCVVPRYGAYAMILTGLLLLLTNTVYYANLPNTPMVIPFESGILRFAFGWCYWLVLATGFICISVGAIIAVIDVVFPHKFSTILEVDYDTPYDRHIILQDKCKEANSRGHITNVHNGHKSLTSTKVGASGSGSAAAVGRSSTLDDIVAGDKSRLGIVGQARDNLGFEGDNSKVSWKRQMASSTTAGIGVAIGGHETLHRTQSVRPRSDTNVNIHLHRASIW